MKLSKIILLISILLLSTGQAYTQNFNKETDLLLANFDLLPDDDDVHAAAALGSMLKHDDFEGVNYYAVAGSYGTQEGYTFINTTVPVYFNALFGEENVDWTNADSDWDGSVLRAAEKVIEVLNAGGKVFVQEAGQSDFTYDVLQEAINYGISLETISDSVTVVQHSNWNQNNTTSSKLDWLKDNTIYLKIADGNTSDNGTPNYKTTETEWMTLAIADDNPNDYAKTFWTMANDICDNWTVYNNPAIRVGGVDYSDIVESWYIFELGIKGDDVESFWNSYVINEPKTPILDSPKPSKVFASKTKGNFIAENTLDGDLDTRWHTNGNGQYIQYKFEEATTLSGMKIAFNKGDKRVVSFQIESTDNPWLEDAVWQSQPVIASSGETLELEKYSFSEPVTAKFFRIVGYGTVGNASGWESEYNSITEVEFIGEAGDTPIIVEGNLNRNDWLLDSSNNSVELLNAIDSNSETRWTTKQAQNGNQWLSVDLGDYYSFNRIELSNAESPDDYPRAYAIYISNDGENWGSVIASGTGDSTKTDIVFEQVSAQYIKIEQTGSVNKYWWSIHELNVSNLN